MLGEGENGVVAASEDGLRRQSDFVRDVSDLTGRIKTAGGRSWLIADGDAYAIAVGIFAALHSGGRAVLPANLQAGHIADVVQTVDGVLTDKIPVPTKVRSLSLFEAEPSQEPFSLTPLDADTAEIVLHTSGTTGTPTSICKPLRCFEAELTSQSLEFAPAAGKTVIATVPPYHIYGLLFRVLWPLATSRPFSTDTVIYPEELVTAAEANPGCMFVSSPAFLKRALPVLDLERLRHCLGPVFSSGGLLPPPVAADYNAVLSQPVIEVYGSTETGGIAYRSVTDAANPPPWQPLPEVEVATDPEQNVLRVRSPFMPDATWFHAGDRAEILEDGRFLLRGRADRIVKVEEERVSLPELEGRLTNSPAVSATRVVLLAGDDNKRQVIGAVIEPSEQGWDIIAAEGRHSLRSNLLDSLSPHMAATVLPRKWRFVLQIPEDDRGKTSDASLAELFREDRGRPLLPDVILLQTAKDNVSFQIHLAEDLLYFDGHFDGAPILAGVVQIDWAVNLAFQYLGISRTFQGVEALKFFNVLMAGDDVVLNLHYHRGTGKLKFEYVNDETCYSSGKVIFQSTT